MTATETSEARAGAGLASLALVFASERAWSLVAGALFVLLLAPLLLTDVPPLLDYPNHLARVFVLASGDDPILSEIYAPNWSLIPNIAVDVLGVMLMQALPVYAAGKVLTALALFLPVVGLLFYARTVSGTRSYWALGCGFLGYNALFLMGFLNFQIALGLALVAAAVWHREREGGLLRTSALVAPIAVAIFFSHVMGIVFLGILLAADELAHVKDTLQRRRIVGRLVALAAVFAPPVALYLASDLSSLGGEVNWFGVWDKLANLSVPFMNYSGRLDALTAALVAAFAYLALRNGWATITPAPAIALALTAVAYAAAPHVYKFGFYFDTRFLLFGMFLLFALFVPKRIPTTVGVAAGLVFGAVFLARMALVGITWHGHNADLSELRQTIAEVEPGSRVLVAAAGPSSAPDYWQQRWSRGRGIAGFRRTEAHMAGLVLIERRAFWPLLFALPSLQPLVVRPEYRDIAMPWGEVPEYTMLSRTELSESEARDFPYLANWAGRFDYVLILDAGGVPELSEVAPERLHLLHATDMAALFTIRNDGR